MHKALQKSIKLWMVAEKEKNTLQIGLFSMIYHYGVQNFNSFELVKLPDEQEDEAWSQTDVDTMLSSILPKITIEENAVTVENVKIPFHKIKEILDRRLIFGL